VQDYKFPVVIFATLVNNRHTDRQGAFDPLQAQPAELKDNEVTKLLQKRRAKKGNPKNSQRP